MRRAGIRAQAIGEAKALRDSASQVSRATLGPAGNAAPRRVAAWPANRRNSFVREARRFPHAVAPGFREIGARRPGQSAAPYRLRRERIQHFRYLGRDRDPRHPGRRSARLAAERLSNPAQLEPLRKINRAMEEISDISLESFTRYLDLNKAFHDGHPGPRQ